MTRTEKLSLLSNTASTLDDAELESVLAIVQHLATGKSVYETAPQHVRDSIHEGLAQLERGEGVPVDEVFASTDKLLKAHGV